MGAFASCFLSIVTAGSNEPTNQYLAKDHYRPFWGIGVLQKQ